MHRPGELRTLAEGYLGALPFSADLGERARRTIWQCRSAWAAYVRALTQNVVINVKFAFMGLYDTILDECLVVCSLR